jgi:hypothetical protein
LSASSGFSRLSGCFKTASQCGYVKKFRILIIENDLRVAALLDVRDAPNRSLAYLATTVRLTALALEIESDIKKPFAIQYHDILCFDHDRPR